MALLHRVLPRAATARALSAASLTARLPRGADDGGADGGGADDDEDDCCGGDDVSGERRT